MEEPLPPNQFKRSVKQRIILGAIALFLVAVGAFIKEIFAKKNPSPVSNTVNTNNDSASSNTTNNKGVTVSGDQNNAGRDVNKIENRKVEVKGPAFFDKSKQVNYYKGLKQRHIDLTLMRKIIDSIPNKNTRIEIACGGDGEGENLGKEISAYLIKRGYSRPILSPWAMTGNYDITEYSYDRENNIFNIMIHPQRNDKQDY